MRLVGKEIIVLVVDVSDHGPVIDASGRVLLREQCHTSAFDERKELAQEDVRRLIGDGFLLLLCGKVEQNIPEVELQICAVLRRNNALSPQEIREEFEADGE